VNPDDFKKIQIKTLSDIEIDKQVMAVRVVEDPYQQEKQTDLQGRSLMIIYKTCESGLAAKMDVYIDIDKQASNPTVNSCLGAHPFAIQLPQQQLQLQLLLRVFKLLIKTYRGLPPPPKPPANNH